MADESVDYQTTTIASPPSTTKVGVDTIGGVSYQKFKLDAGGDGSLVPIIAGRQVDAASVPVALSSEDVALIDTLESLLGSIKTAAEALSAIVSGGALKVDDDATQAALAGSIAVTNAGLTELAAAIDTELQVDVVGALPAGNNNIGDVDIASIAAGTNNIGDVDVLTVPADPFGANADASSATGSISAKLRAIATAVEILDNAVAGSEIQVDVVGALPAGTNAIGKLAANSGVDIGDVDVTSIAAGTNTIGATVNSGHATAGTGQSTLSDGDADNTDQEIKGTAGRLYYLQVYNPNSAVSYLQLFDDATVTVGTDTPKLSFPIPPMGFWDASFDPGIHFANAIHYACTTTRAGSGDPATGLVLNAGYV